MKKRFWTVFCTICAVTAANAGKIYWVSPSENSFPGWQGVTTATKTFTTIKAALADTDLADEDTVVLDKCTFDLSYENRANEICAKTTIGKRITLTGAGGCDDTTLDGGRETNANGSSWDRRWANHSPCFEFGVSGIVFQNMTFTRMGANGMPNIQMADKLTGCVISNMVFRDTGVGYSASSWQNIKGMITRSNNGSFVISACKFTGNAFPCAMIYTIGAGAAGTRVENCYIASNTCTGAKYDYGVVDASFNGLLRNNTIVGNKTPQGAVYHASSNCRVVNNIVYGNTDLAGVETKDACQKGGSATVWTYNCIGQGETTYTGEGNLFTDPGLAADSMHLSSDSPCIGKASAAYAPKVDVEGVERDSANPCVGCSEFVSKVKYTCEVEATEEKVWLPDTVTLSVVITGTPSGELTYAWDFEGDGTIDATTATAILDKVGRYNVSVTVRDEGGSGDPVAAFYSRPIYVYAEGKTNFTWYVSPSGNGKNPASGFPSGFTTIKAAFANPDLTDGDTILLDTCTFDLSFANKATIGDITETLSITNSITFAGSGTRNETILDGGEEFAGGRRYNGKYHFPGFLVKADNVTIRNMTMTRMGSDDASTTLSVENGYMGCRIENVVFRDTGLGYASWRNFKGIVQSGDKNTVLSGCSFVGNRTPSCVLYATGGSQARVENCYFSGNVCTGEKTSTGQQYNYGVIYANFGASGDGWFCNNTVVSNKSAIGAVYHAGSGCRVVNSIVCGNTDLDGEETKNSYLNGDLASLWTYNCLDEGSAVFTGAGNIFVDPGLAGDNLHLQSDSPCVGKASAAYAPATDIDGATRLTAPCMGCSEYVGSASFTCTIVPPASQFASLPETIALTAQIEGEAVEPLAYAWDFNSDGIVDSTEEHPALSEAGRYYVTVTVVDGEGKDRKSSLNMPLYVYPEDKAKPGEHVFCVLGWENPKAQAPFTNWVTAANSIKGAYTNAVKFAASKIILGDGVYPVTSTMTLTNGMTVTSLNGRGKAMLTRPNLAEQYGMLVINDPTSVIECVTLCGAGPTKKLYAHGAAVNLTAGIVRDCVVSNFCNKNYGVIKITANKADRPVRIERCVVSDNTDCDATQIAVYMNGYATVENCLFRNNVGSHAGSSVFHNYSWNSVIRNCTFADNHTVDTMPVLFKANPSVFENNIITGCTTNNREYAANDVLYYDTNKSAFQGPISAIRHSCIHPAACDYSGKAGVITVDPAFVGDGDYQLLRNTGFKSPCIDKGTNYLDKTELVGLKDLDGNKRLIGRRVDMGCYECQWRPGLSLIVR